MVDRQELDNKALIRAEMQSIANADIEEMTWEEYRSVWDGLEDIENGVLWGRALVCAAIESQYGEESIKAFADDVQIGESTAYSYRRTWLSFPRIDDRHPELSFSHHRIAANTNNPQYWIEDASMHMLSTHALKRKIYEREQKTKAVLIEEQKKALEAGEVPPDPDDIQINGNHNVPLAPTMSPTFSAKEREAAEEELKASCSQWFMDRIEEGYLYSDVIKAMKTIMEESRGVR